MIVQPSTNRGRKLISPRSSSCQGCVVFCQILTKVGICQQVLVKIRNTKFHEYSFCRVAVLHEDDRTDITRSVVSIRLGEVHNDCGLAAVSFYTRRTRRILSQLGIEFHISIRGQSFTLSYTWIFFKGLNKLRLPSLTLMCAVIVRYFCTQSNTLGTGRLEKHPRILHTNFTTSKSSSVTLKSL